MFLIIANILTIAELEGLGDLGGILGNGVKKGKEGGRCCIHG